MTPKKAYSLCYEGKRIPELENIILLNIDYSYAYARDIIKGSWKKGENVISTDPKWSYYYSILVIRIPFQKSHLIIFNSEYKDDYISFLKKINYDYTEWLI